MPPFHFFVVFLGISIWKSCTIWVTAEPRISTIPRYRIYNGALSGYEDFFSPNFTDCSNKCLTVGNCRSCAWRPPTTCSLYAGTSLTASDEYTAGVKITTGSFSTPFSFSWASIPSSPNSFLMYGSPILVQSRLKLAFRESQGGFALLTDPVQILRDASNRCFAASFTAAFSFQMKVLTSGGAKDGFSFFLTQDNELPNSDQTYMGFPEQQQRGVALEFDTFKDTDYRDPDDSHVGVNVNFNPTSAASATTKPSRLNDGTVKYAWVQYNATSSLLSAFISNANAMPAKAVLSYSVNLCSVFRPPSCPSCARKNAVFFGFSTRTGDENFQTVDVLSWSLSTTWPAAQPGTSLSPCTTLDSAYFGGNTFFSSYTSSAASCCSTCRSRLDCLSFYWEKSEKTCSIIGEPLGSPTSDSSYVAGFISLSMYEHPVDLALPSFSSGSPIFLRGDTVVDSKKIVLTNSNYQAGYAFLRQPVQVLQNANSSCSALSFSAAFSFRIYNGPDESQQANGESFGEGFTFFLLSGAGFRNYMEHREDWDLGLYYYDSEFPPGILAVEFDTFQNAEVKDPPAGHVGINIGFSAQSLATGSADDVGVQLNDSSVKYAWVDYDSRLNFLSVYLSYLSLKPKTPAVEVAVDLCRLLRPDSASYVHDLLSAFVGFSARTTYYNYQAVEIRSLQFKTSLASPDDLWPLPRALGLRPPPAVSPKRNSLFRYLSSGYLSQTNIKRNPSWLVATRWNWTEDATSAVADQGNCSSCYAFAAVAAVESALYLASYSNGAQPLSLSPQQAVDCAGAGKCYGGSPAAVLDYAVATGLALASARPYQAKNATTCSVPQGTLYKVSSFESVNFMDWLGILLAVQQQPVIASVEASSPTFMIYSGGVYDDEDCYVNGVDHSVMIVGYNIVSQPPYWILRNSWGSKWGEQGHMRMAIRPGDGICGINTNPGLIPVPAFKDPCNQENYPRLSGVFNWEVAPGRMNPCGGGTCSVSGSSNKCVCPRDFAPKKNSDGSETCAPVEPCSFFSENPCNSGTCANSLSDPGSYTCICPLGYELGSFAEDGKPTCVPASLTSGIKLFTVPLGYSLTCPVVYQQYGLLKSSFINQNKNLNLDCTKAVPAGTKLNVTNDFIKGCDLPYAINKGDTCDSIRVLFKLPSISGPGSPNPELDCSQLQPGQQICITRRSSTGSDPGGVLPLCTNLYRVQFGETCQSIIQSRFSGQAAKFFSLNPGLYCTNFNAVVASNSTLGMRVCVASTDAGTILKGCTQKVVVPSPGDSCTSIFRKFFCGKRLLFRRFNKKWTCESKRLFVGSQAVTKRVALCAPRVC